MIISFSNFINCISLMVISVARSRMPLEERERESLFKPIQWSKLLCTRWRQMCYYPQNRRLFGVIKRSK